MVVGSIFRKYTEPGSSLCWFRGLWELCSNYTEPFILSSEGLKRASESVATSGGLGVWTTPGKFMTPVGPETMKLSEQRCSASIELR